MCTVHCVGRGEGGDEREVIVWESDDLRRRDKETGRGGGTRR